MVFDPNRHTIAIVKAFPRCASPDQSRESFSFFSVYKYQRKKKRKSECLKRGPQPAVNYQ